MTQYVEYIDRYTVKPAKLPLIEYIEEDGRRLKRRIYNPTEADYNRLGFYALVREPYPADTEHVYRECYEKDGLQIRQGWEQGELIEPAPVETPTDIQTAFNTLAENVQGVTTIKGLVKALTDTANQIGEGIE